MLTQYRLCALLDCLSNGFGSGEPWHEVILKAAEQHSRLLSECPWPQGHFEASRSLRGGVPSVFVIDGTEIYHRFVAA